MKDKHAEAFVQEAIELLEVLESSLLELEENPKDEELIQKIFRALHTIKGSGGMFGFDAVSAFVHNIETVYDKIRNGKQPVTIEIIDATLKACDQISIMVKSEKDKSYDDNKSIKEILNFFKQLSDENVAVKNENDEPKHIESTITVKVVYHISFAPNEDILLKGTKPGALLKEISELGEVIIIPNTDKIPIISEYNHEKVYSSWDIILSTDKGINAIKDVFIFVEDDCKLDITQFDQGALKGDLDYYLSKINGRDISVMKDNKVKKTTSIISEKVNPISEKKITEIGSLSSIRVSSDKLDTLINLVGELVTVQARLTEFANMDKGNEIISIAEEVERLTWDLRENALNIRMLPIESTFKKFNRLVRDLSKELGKEVELITEGGETELDKNVIEKLNDPLVHIIRNCIDHGIELPDERMQNAKDKVGKIYLSAIHSGTHVIVKIKDDGAGLNKKVIYEKALERELISEDAKLSDNEIFSLIFKPGFSTAKTVTNVSGRGVGMDVVRNAIEALRGLIEVESKTVDKERQLL